MPGHATTPHLDPLGGALLATITPAIRDAVAEALAEHAEAQPLQPALLTHDQVCQALQVSRTSLYRLVERGMPRVMVLDSPRYRLADVLAWLEAQQGARRA